ncbi:MAG: polymerase sigma factor [Chitinophagaceae bacterium]|nr:polymerase sigma factor [Chitinophagaceae bacterium]MDB5222664.1 polymerase sigma factor [Chitinophagaceae bacterium]
MSLQEILEGCMENNSRDHRHLYEKYYGYSLKIVFRYIYRYDKATDVVNDGFVKVFSKLYQFHYEASQNLEMIFMGWLKTIMIHTAIDRLRKDSFLPEIGMSDEQIWITDKSQSADQSLLYKELINEIKKLPPGYRVVFNMYVIDGFTHQEIANQLKIAVGTSKSNLSKAKALLRSYIKTNELQVQVCNP